MRYEVKLEGVQPVIMHDGYKGLLSTSPEKVEIATITGKRGKKTEVDEARVRELECQLSLWQNEKGEPTIPATAFRSCIENGARKLKKGAAVREGLIVLGDGIFVYDKNKYGTTVEELGRLTQFTVPVVVQRNRIMRTRAKFDKWQCTFEIDVDEALIDQQDLMDWLDIAGHRVGLGDWRPQKSGRFGMFEAWLAEKPTPQRSR